MLAVTDIKMFRIILIRQCQCLSSGMIAGMNIQSHKMDLHFSIWLMLLLKTKVKLVTNLLLLYASKSSTIYMCVCVSVVFVKVMVLAEVVHL